MPVVIGGSKSRQEERVSSCGSSPPSIPLTVALLGGMVVGVERRRDGDVDR